MIDLYLQKKRCYPLGGFAVDLDISTAGVTQTVKAPKASTSTIIIQKLTVVVLTGSAGITWQFEGTAGTPDVTNPLDMSTAGAVFEFDYGPKGHALDAGDSLLVTISGANAAGHIHVEGYQV